MQYHLQNEMKIHLFLHRDNLQFIFLSCSVYYFLFFSLMSLFYQVMEFVNQSQGMHHLTDQLIIHRRFKQSYFRFFRINLSTLDHFSWLNFLEHSIIRCYCMIMVINLLIDHMICKIKSYLNLILRFHLNLRL
jgi:hypothetical protein